MSGQGTSSTAVTIAIPNSFTIEEFDANNIKWSRWLQRLLGAFKIFNITGDARVPYLLHYVGSAVFDILCDRLDPENPYNQSFESLTAKLDELYAPPPLEIAENFKFHQRRQMEGETVQQFAAALHKLSIHCKFGIYLKRALRNQLVFGLANKKIQTRLLEKNLTYDEALIIATTMELSEKDSESLQEASMRNATSIELLQADKPGKKRKKKGSDSDSDEDWGKKAPGSTAKKGGGGGGKGKEGGYTRALTLSPKLAAVFGAEQIARHEDGRKMWSIRGLYDFDNKKQFTICEDELMKIIIQRFRTFGMMKYLKNYL